MVELDGRILMIWDLHALADGPIELVLLVGWVGVSPITRGGNCQSHKKSCLTDFCK